MVKKRSFSIPMRESVQLRAFDPKEVYRKHIEGRKIIYLDNLFWIDLTDQKTETSRRAFELCMKLKTQDMALFPISESAMNELIDQRLPDKRLDQARVMDRLSGGVSFRAPRYINEIELDAAVHFMKTGQSIEPDKSMLFSYVGDYVGDGYYRVPATFTKEQLDSFRAYMLPFQQSVEKIISLDVISSLQTNHKESLEQYMQWMTTDKPVHSNMDNALLEERVNCFDIMVRPHLSKKLIKACNYDADEIEMLFSRFAEDHREGGARLLALFLSKMPSVDLLARIMAARKMDRARKVCKNDFYDTEHARFAIYADFFLTEKNLCHYLNNVCRLSEYRKQLIVDRGMERLISICESLT